MAGIELRSPSFGDHQPIPTRHAKDHDNLSPALEWSGVTEEAVELAVLCEDPDAPRGTFIHWVLAGLEPTAPGLVEGERPAAAVEGRNDFGEERYSGPQPPVGDPPHRYCFWVFAASAPLELTAGASAEDLRRALEGGELASGTLVGTISAKACVGASRTARTGASVVKAVPADRGAGAGPGRARAGPGAAR
jgi:Raf kinase inhibitor-like YbhB/YbcL family protein